MIRHVVVFRPRDAVILCELRVRLPEADQNFATYRRQIEAVIRKAGASLSPASRADPQLTAVTLDEQSKC